MKNHTQLLAEYKENFLNHYNSTRKINAANLENEYKVYAESVTKFALTTSGKERKFDVDEVVKQIENCKFSDAKQYHTKRVFLQRMATDELNWLQVVHELLSKGYTFSKEIGHFTTRAKPTTTYITLIRPEIDEEANKIVSKAIAEKALEDELKRIKAEYFSADAVQAYLKNCEKEQAEQAATQLQNDIDLMLNDSLNTEIDEYLKGLDVVVMADFKAKFDSADSEYLRTKLADNGFSETRKTMDGANKRVWAK